MALSDVLGFFKPDLKSRYEEKPADPTKARKPLLKGIANSRKQFENGTTKVPNRWWSASNGVVAFTPKLDGRILEINGVGTNHMPEDRFVEFLDVMKAAVDAGDFDEVIENHGRGNTDVQIAPKPPSGTKRKMTEQGSLNIRVGGMRRGGKSDADIRSLLEGDGVAADLIAKALAPKGKQPLSE